MYQISKDDLQKVLNYLASKPYGEVFELVKIVQGAKEIENKGVNEDQPEGEK
jgi:hypothetical protein